MAWRHFEELQNRIQHDETEEPKKRWWWLVGS